MEAFLFSLSPSREDLHLGLVFWSLWVLIPLSGHQLWVTDHIESGLAEEEAKEPGQEDRHGDTVRSGTVQSILIVIGILFFLSMLEWLLESYFDWMPYKKLYEGADPGFIRGGLKRKENQFLQQFLHFCSLHQSKPGSSNYRLAKLFKIYYEESVAV